MPPSALSRTITILASAFLAFDGAALIGLGWWTAKTSLAVVGVVLLLSSGAYSKRTEGIACRRDSGTWQLEG